LPLELDDLLNPNRSPFAPKKIRKDIDLDDEARFLKSWFENPLKTGAVAPSGKLLAQRMAAMVDPMVQGPVVELGPGTGPVTQALLQRGVAPQRLFLVEYSKDFASLLRQRFPGVTVIEGDAYGLAQTLAGHVDAPIAAIVSSLPLLTRPDAQRSLLLEAAFDLMLPGSPFVQFTYMNNSPVPLSGDFEATVSRRIWKNLPPARIWTYRRPTI
jgi:phosphatidylethanolamine/phosphatidyl-N-methylethanolamine N-methyltransferase